MVDSIGELDKQIREELGFSDEDMNHYFLFKEQGEQFIVQERRWLPPTLGGLKLKRLMDRLGAEREEHNGKALFIVEKGREVEAPTPKVAPREQLESAAGPQPVTTKNNSKNTYDLKASVEILPMLKEARPIIQDEKGVKIDGFNRLRVDKDWPTKTVKIEDELTRMIARFALNFCRRKLSDKEKRDAMVAFHLKTGWSPKEMSERLPISYSFIMKYLPDEYKDKEMAKLGKKGAEVKAEVDKRLATRHIAEEPILHRCGFSTIESYDHGTYDPKFVEGIPLCSHHHELVKNDPSLLKKLKEKPSQPQKVEKKTYDPLKPTWEDRKRLMRPHHSIMEDMIRRKLEDAKIRFKTDVKFPVVETEPDFWLPEHGIFVYLDGKQVHMKREAKDDWIRVRVAKQEKVRVLGLTFPDNTKKSQDEIWQEILGAVSDVAGRG